MFPMPNRTIHRIVWFILATAFIYALWVLVTDAQRNIEVLRAFPWQILPLVLGSVTVNFFLRWVKWEWFRRSAGLDVPLSGSFLVYFSGYSMAISPGRVGELIKPFMYKEYFGCRMRRTIPLVLSERISDLLGMLILTVATIGAYGRGVLEARGQDSGSGLTVPLLQGFLGLSVALMIGGIVLARSKAVMYWFLLHMARIKGLVRISHKLRKLYHRTYPLLTIRNLVVASALAAVSWFFECYALMLILHGVGATSVTLAEATFMFCMATIIGGLLFFMPGGLGGFEGSMTGMLAMLKLANGTPAIVLIRFCTLFYSVFLGFAFIFITSLVYHKDLKWEEFEKSGDSED
jgi:uncharacterized membrane protein YbhN (UPF0104 family)